MKVLILSCSTGQGHNAVSAAIAEQFEEKGIYCEILDALQFISDRTARFMSWGHSFMYRHFPKLFQTGYSAAERHTSALEEGSAAYKFFGKGAEDLREYCVENHFDHILCTHVFSALMLTEAMRENPFCAKTYFVATDYTCSPGTLESELDCYFIPDESIAHEFAGKRTHSVGIPIRREFYHSEAKELAKAQMGVAPKHTHILMMCGSMGCGPMEELAELLSEGMGSACELTVVCGTNQKMYERLKKDHADHPNVHILGFVHHISQLMDSADLYVTKPGGISTTEAMAKGLPMVLVDAVAGCEDYNLRFFEKIADTPSAREPEEIAVHCLTLSANKTAQAEMSQALRKHSKNGAKGICEYLLRKETEHEQQE